MRETGVFNGMRTAAGIGLVNAAATDGVLFASQYLTPRPRVLPLASSFGNQAMATPLGRVEANVSWILKSDEHDQTKKRQLGVGLSFF